MLNLAKWENDYLSVCKGPEFSSESLFNTADGGEKRADLEDERDRIVALELSLQTAFDSSERDIETIQNEISDLESLLYVDPGHLVRDRIAGAKERLKGFVSHFVNMRDLLVRYGLEKVN